MTELAQHQVEGIERFFARMGPRLQRADSLLGQDPGKEHPQARQEWANAVYEAWAWPGWVFAWAMGAGKTLAALTILARWPTFVSELNLSPPLRAALKRPALIVGPAANRFVWDEQAHRHGLYLVSYTAESDEDFSRAGGLLSGGALEAFVASYTGLARNRTVLGEHAFSIGIFDEAQKVGNNATQAAQAIYHLARMRADAIPGLPVRLALSGTPFLNHIEQLWPVLALVNGFPLPRKRGDGAVHYVLKSPGNLWFEQAQFERAYASVSVNAFGRRQLRGRNLFHDPEHNPDCRTHERKDCNCLHERMLRLSVHRVSAEVAERNIPESPPPEWVPVPIGAWQKKLYRHVVEKAEIPLEGAGQTVKRMALITYAFEIAASTEQLRESLRARGDPHDLAVGGFPVQPESTKLDYIVDLMEGLDAPAIVATGYARFAKQIAGDPRLQPYKPLLLAGSGSLSAEKFQERMWSGEHRLGVVTTMGATGLNLQCASYVIVAGFYDWSPLNLLQLIARAKRTGQTRRVVSYILYDPATIEGWLRDKLKVKIENAAAVMDGDAAGADEIGLGQMGHGDFVSIFYGDKRRTT